VTRTPLSRTKGQRSRSPARFTHRGVNASGSCSGDRGKVLTVGAYCYVAVCRRSRLGGSRRFGAHRGRRGVGTYCGGRPPTACSGWNYGLLVIPLRLFFIARQHAMHAERDIITVISVCLSNAGIVSKSTETFWTILKGHYSTFFDPITVAKFQVEPP